MTYSEISPSAHYGSAVKGLILFILLFSQFRGNTSSSCSFPLLIVRDVYGWPHAPDRWKYSRFVRFYIYNNNRNSMCPLSSSL